MSISDFPSKRENSALQPDEMQRILFKAFLVYLQKVAPAKYDLLVIWWANQS